MIDTLSNSVLQNVPYNTVPYNTLNKNSYILSLFRINQLQLHVKQSYQVSCWLSMREESFLEEVGDILEGLNIKFIWSVTYNTKSDVPYNTMTCLLPSASKACRYDALTNHLLPFKIDISSI